LPESLPLTHDTIKLSHSAEGEPIEARPATEDTAAMLNDDVMIEIAPDRPCGTIRVRLVYAGPSMPLLADGPWAE
jgi:hypothetical protein